jgi:NitT/TauT family transport system permease protein
MRRQLDSVLFALAVLAVWELLFLVAGEEAIASPWQTLRQLAELIPTAAFWGHVGATFEAFGWAVMLSIVAGLAIGLVLGLWPLAGEVAEPLLNAGYAIPKITLYPVILLFFGLGLPAKVAFGTIHGIFPVILLTMNGVRTIRPVIRKTAQAMRLGPFETMRTVLLPAALPEIFSGLRIGVSLTLLGTLIGELFASNKGLGFLLMRSADRHDVPTTMALILLLFAVAAAAGAGLLAVDRRLHHDARPTGA